MTAEHEIVEVPVLIPVPFSVNICSLKTIKLLIFI